MRSSRLSYTPAERPAASILARTHMPHNPRRPLINPCRIDFEMVYLMQHLFLSNYITLHVTIYPDHWNQSAKARPTPRNTKMQNKPQENPSPNSPRPPSAPAALRSRGATSKKGSFCKTNAGPLRSPKVASKKGSFCKTNAGPLRSPRVAPKKGCFCKTNAARRADGGLHSPPMAQSVLKP